MDRRDAATLLPEIEANILPGSEIWSDEWPAYVNVDQIPVNPPYIHDTVNHSRFFTDPVTGVCTNHVESYWRQAKEKLKSMYGVHEGMLDSYLDEFQWRQRWGRNGGETTLTNLLSHLAAWPRYATP